MHQLLLRPGRLSRSLGPSMLMGVVAVVAGVVSTTPAHAAKPAWDQVANVKDAAERLAKLQRSAGANGVLKFLDACYRTHTLASKFTQGLEACMAQDYMHTRVLTTIYSKLPPEARNKPDVLTPEAIAKGLGDRFAVIINQYAISRVDAEAFKRTVDTHGFPLFLSAVFPNAGGTGGGAGEGAASPPPASSPSPQPKSK